jgi:hypothetical protein
MQTGKEKPFIRPKLRQLLTRDSNGFTPGLTEQVFGPS